MSKREAFLDAVCMENVEDFLRFIQLHNDKTEPFDVEEVLHELSRKQREVLWMRLATLLHDILLELPPEGWEPGAGAEDREEGMEVQVSADPKRTRSVVESVTLVAMVSLKVLEDGDTYSALLECANRLHDVLVSLPVSQTRLDVQIHKLCDSWWKKGLQGKEKMGHTAFLLSLQKTLVLKKAAEMESLWSLRDVLLGLDYTSEDNKNIIHLLLECFLLEAFFRHDDGKRFLVFLFSWNVDFIWKIHGTIKNQLEFFTKTTTDHVAEIYFRAWKKATGDFLEKIESVCIQDFMQHAILLDKASPVHAKVRQIMSHFHKRKGAAKVDKMFYTLYKPILWKALSAPNFEVRANATLLFMEAFAIHDPSQSSENIDQAIQKQLDTLMRLLDDPHPKVRCIATLGVCKVMATCWGVLPPVVIADFMKKLVVEMAADISSPDVRCACFKSLTVLLDNPLSHPLLASMLPALKYSLHDNSEKVRTAFLDMLIKVKAVRAAKFWEVCNMDHLLAALAIGSPSVSKRIVNLLFKSYFPVNEQEGKAWCCRCVTLIGMNPMAARKFYQYAYLHTSPTNIIKLMLSIRRLLNSCIADFDQTGINDSNKENTMIAERSLLVKDVALVSSLLEVVVILWRSIEKSLKNNKEAQEYTFTKFGSVMAKYFSTFEDERCTAPLIHLASLMTPTAVPAFSCGVLSKLRRMDPGAVPTQYSRLLDCLCNWGQVVDILELVADWLSQALPKKADQANTGRKVRIQETVEAKPDLALDYLDYLLSHTSTRESVLSLSQGSLKQLHKVLGSWRCVLSSHLSSSMADPKDISVETALKAFTAYGRLAAHLQHSSSEGRDFLLSLELVAEWVAETVLPFLNKRSDDGEAEEPQELARQITESFLTICRDVLLVGLGDDTFKRNILHHCSLILLSEEGYLCIPLLLPVLKEVAESFVPEGSQGQEDQEDPATVILTIVENIFQQIVELLARRVKNEAEEGKQLCQSAVPGLADFLEVVQTWEGVPANPLLGVFSTLFAYILVEKTRVLKKKSHSEEVITTPESVEEMPPLPRVLLSVILKSSPVTRAFLREITSNLDSDDSVKSPTELAAVLQILVAIGQTGRFKKPLQDAARSVQSRHVVGDNGDIQRVFESAANFLLDQMH